MLGASTLLCQDAARKKYVNCLEGGLKAPIFAPGLALHQEPQCLAARDDPLHKFLKFRSKAADEPDAVVRKVVPVEDDLQVWLVAPERRRIDLVVAQRPTQP